MSVASQFQPSTLKRGSKLVRRAVARIFRHKNPTPLQYWKDRALTYGPRAVLNLGHQEGEYDDVTRMQEHEVFPHLRAELNGTERIILDFGCGPGRFTADLAQLIRGKAVGVDPVRRFLRAAPRHDAVSYRVLDGQRIPLEDGSVDVVWSCLVLGGIGPDAIGTAALEMQRVMRDGGLLFFVENTSTKADGEFWKYRSVEQYQSIFPSIRLRHLHDYFDLGERISVMAGRKPPAK